jgi:hypothetical protein
MILLLAAQDRSLGSAAAWLGAAEGCAGDLYLEPMSWYNAAI